MIGNAPRETQNASELTIESIENSDVDVSHINNNLGGDLSDELMNDMRASVLVQAEGETVDPANQPPTLADFKMLVVLGKGTFGKVFLAEFNKNKQLYAIKVIRKDILIEYN